MIRNTGFGQKWTERQVQIFFDFWILTIMCYYATDIFQCLSLDINLLILQTFAGVWVIAMVYYCCNNLHQCKTNEPTAITETDILRCLICKLHVKVLLQTFSDVWRRISIRITDSSNEQIFADIASHGKFCEVAGGS